MGRNRYVSLILILMLFCCFIYSCCGYEFIVGGRDGYWVSNPSENYNHWAQRMRFQVNDTLLFKYKEAGSDSVVEVNTLDDYEKCNSTNGHPINDAGNNSSSVIFTFDRSGPFYFITANKTNCDKGQKLIIVVMAVRNRPPPIAPAAPPSEPPAASGPSANSFTPPGNGGGTGNTPVPAAAPPSENPAASGPSANSPTPPGNGGGGNTPVPAAAPPSETPAASGPSANSSTPPGNGGGGNTPVPAAAQPSEPPAASGPSANSSTPGGGSSTGNTPADVTSPPRSFAAASYAPSVVLVSAVSLLFSVVLGGWNIYY
ncbi:hypothetical protein RD792_006542 [Penstemon davidsonii]|uniref:Phytocyanin domain-containing protein n=2 Tax=Penstemon davidsonii TaxID=160366 RepID=A0ABR0DDA7_9LAMI|nr:hypothetical protein RD792_006542 [Penstemon davidsonii]